MTKGCAAATISTIVVSLVLSSQLCGQPPTTRSMPAWLPRVTDPDRIPRADKAIIEANLAAAEGLVARISGYAKPRGFEVRPWWSNHPAEPRNRLSTYEVSFTVFVPTKHADPDGHGGFAITFNPDLSALSAPTIIDEENGGKLYVERGRSDPVLGATITYGVFGVKNTEGLRVLFTSSNQSPMIPVTREEYLRAKIFQSDKDDQKMVKAARVAYAKSPYETWIEGAADRKKIREGFLSNITDKAEAAKTRSEMEAAERKTTEDLKKNEANFRAEAARALKATTTPFADTLRARLAAMSPAERASPAWIVFGDLVPAGTPQARAVIRENPAFYRARRSPFEPRAILVVLPGATDVAMEAHRQLYRELDWGALKSLLDQRP